MDPRYYRSASPRHRYATPARASTGMFGGEYDSYYSPRYSRDGYSPRSSVDRVMYPASQTYGQLSVPSSNTWGAYTGRSRSSTHGESEAPRLGHSRTQSIPVRSTRPPVIHTGGTYEADPIARSWDARDGGYITPASSNPTRRDYKKYYVPDGHSARLVDEHPVDPRRDSTGYQSAGPSSSRPYPNTRRPSVPLYDEDFSLIEPAETFNTEPVRRPRRSSMESRQRPPSIHGAYTSRSSREKGPPPSTRGFDKINNTPSSSSSSHRKSSSGGHRRSSSMERAADNRSSGEFYPPLPPRPASSNRHRPTTIHQDGDDRRDSRQGYRPEYDEQQLPPRPASQTQHRENRRHSARYEDKEVAQRGFGIRPTDDYDRKRETSIDREPLYDPVHHSAPPKDHAEPNNYDTSSREYDRREQERRDREFHREVERQRQKEADRDQHHHYDRDDDRSNGHRRPSDRDRRDAPRESGTSTSLVVPAVVAAGAAYGASEAIDRRGSDRDGRYPEDEDRSRRHRRDDSDGSYVEERQRHYAQDDDRKDDRRASGRDREAELQAADADYQRRLQEEATRNSKSRGDRDSESDRERERRRKERKERRDDDVVPRDRYRDDRDPRGSGPLPESRMIAGPGVPDPGSDSNNAERSLRIYDPNSDPNSSPPPLKGILKTPTQKFPEDPNPIREGVAPLKDAKKGKDIPPNARWTKIDRSLVNPEALDDAKERYEERMDCVIVLRVLTKDDIQKLADRTREIREAREAQYEKERRDRRRSRSGRQDRREDDYDSEEDERYHANDGQRMIEDVPASAGPRF